MNKRILHNSCALILLLLHIDHSQSRTIFLATGWTITNANQSIHLVNQTIPSGVYSALESANITPSVFDSYNDVNLRWIANDNWTYKLRFPAPGNVTADQSAVLIFYGIDTIANIFLNGHKLAPIPQNMFVRYQYNILNYLQVDNELKVEFVSPIVVAKKLATIYKFTPPECPPIVYNGECHINFLRKMQASFSWDWGLAAPSMGIWKPVVIEIYNTAVIRDVNYALRLSDNTWFADVKVFLETQVDSADGVSFDGYLTIEITDLLDVPIRSQISVRNLKSNEFKHIESFNVSASKVQLWWPNGYGAQKLYTLTATWQAENYDVSTNKIINVPSVYSSSAKSVRVGFRTIEIIETALDRGKTFYFEVNGIPIFMKGTNWIPSSILPEKSFDSINVEYLLKAVKNAHMNMIRVWGGGIYETDQFYDFADELGILIWQDMMFACAMYPVFDEFMESVGDEIKQNIRRLQSHPSIAIWAGNNENEAALVQNWYGTKSDQNRFVDEYIKLYTHIKDVLTNDDQSHIWTYSSPSNAISNSTIINKNPQDDAYGDIHFYNYFSDGWNPNIFPKPRFVSEYGFQSLPSLNSWKSVLGSNDSLSTLIDHRQHHPLGNGPIILLIQTHLPLPQKDDERYTEAFVYFSQISQAMATKTETESYRVGRGMDINTMGALYWQLNDVWVAPSWSSIEHNGNFKILHNWAAEFFAPLHVVAQIDNMKRINVHVLRDSLGETKHLEVILRIFNWSSFEPNFERKWDFEMKENSVHEIDQFAVTKYVKEPITKQNSFMQFLLIDQNDNNATVSTNFLFVDHIKNAVGISDPKIKLRIAKEKCSADKANHTIDLEITASHPAIFVYIQLNNKNIPRYVFSKNGFMQVTPKETVSVSFKNLNCTAMITEDDFKIISVNEFFPQN